MTIIRKPVGSATGPGQNERSAAEAEPGNEGISLQSRGSLQHLQVADVERTAANSQSAGTAAEVKGTPDLFKVSDDDGPGSHETKTSNQAKDANPGAQKEEDSGSDWDPVDDDSGDEFDHFENMSGTEVTSDLHKDPNVQQTSREIKPQDQLPPSLRIGHPPGLHIVKNSNSKPASTEDLGISHLSVEQHHPPSLLTAHKETNPFLRKNTSNNAAELESSAPQWKDESRAEPQQPSFQTQQPRPLPSQLSQSSATGIISDPKHPVNEESGFTAIGLENPWDDWGQVSGRDSQKINTQDNESELKRANIRQGKQPAVDQEPSLIGISGSDVPPEPPQHPPPPPKVPSPAPPVTTEQLSGQEESILDKPLQPTPATEFSPSLPPQQQQQQQQQPEGKSRPTQQTKARSGEQKKNEHYSIKHIRWYDASSQSFRISPILIQNANGPCPLLALINALVLSTPKNMETVLVESLRTREQVSLGLLLDATFEELMSGRHGETEHPLPDVGDLYAFLVTLHTGMNVNPRFVPRKSADSPEKPPPQKLGGFEDTRELRLYGAFGVPLIHGWLPKANDLSYGAFERVAQTYEDAQNVQFHEEELEAKLRNESLTDQEQAIFVDLTFVKEFLSTWPTQLTESGLQSMQDNLGPGQICILFRNDHFSTIYKEPRTGTLMTLVTDAGYATHDEIVWESLVDINGSESELFAGNFQSVSHSVPGGQGPDDGGSWTTVTNKRNSSRPGGGPGHESTASSIPATSVTVESSESSVVTSNAPGRLSTAEQQDHDLALALQLQEEEEERHRSEQAARQRNEALSEEFLSQESGGRENRPALPPRRGGRRTQAEDIRRTQTPTPPPSYDHVNNDDNGPLPQYGPRPGSASHLGGGRGGPNGYRGRAGVNGYGRGAGSGLPNAQASLQNNQQLGPGGRGYGRKTSSVGGQAGGGTKEEKCVLM